MGKIIVAVVLTALIAGAGTYYYVSNRANTNSATLLNTINNLNSKVTELEQPVTINTNASTVVTTCAAADLSAALSNGSGAAGTYYYTLSITNKGTVDCVITGSPKLVALSSTGAVLGQTAPSQSSNRLIVSPNTSVFSSVGFPNSGNFSAGVCKPMKTLMVYIADQTTGIAIANIDQYSSVYTSKYCQPFSVTEFSASGQ